MTDVPAYAPLRTVGQIARAIGDAGAGRAATDGRDAALERFLLAAAVCQALEDRLRRDVPALDRLAQRWDGHAGATRASPRLRAFTRALADGAFSLRMAMPTERRWERERGRWSAVVTAFAEDVVAPSPAALDRPGGEVAHAGDLEPLQARLLRSRRRREIARTPACFSTFDQHPDDLRLLVDRLAARYPSRDRPLLVVGLRTSGSHLAPLCAALLRLRGYAETRWITVRTSCRLGPAERRALTTAAATGALVLVVDDPPRTGAQVLAAAALAETAGIPPDRIVPLLALLPDSGRIAALLSRYPAVLLPWDCWTIRAALRGAELHRVLEPLLVGQSCPSPGDAPPGRIRALRSVDHVAVAAPHRGHASATITVTLQDDGDREVPLRVHAQGIGIGPWAAPALAGAQCLDEFVPRVYGTAHGLLFREWLGEDLRATARPEALRDRGLAAAIAGYVAARKARLPLPRDLSLRLVGEAVWEEAAVLLARAFGDEGAGYAVARPLARLASRRLLAVQAPALVDGDMRMERWFVGADGSGPPLRKSGGLTGRYSPLRLQTADWVVDLAAAAADLERRGLPAAAAAVREHGERETGIAITDERWLLYRLLDHLILHDGHLRDATPDAVGEAVRLERLMACACREYVASAFLGDVTPAADGPLCAIDIDGVLEERWVAFPMLPPAGALALRALHQHGFRPVLASGRPGPEVWERCGTYRMAGAVAEYGAVVHVEGGACRDLLSPQDREHLAAIRRALTAEPGVHVDDDQRHGVRAYRAGDAGRPRTALRREQVDAALRRAPSGVVRAIGGRLQTDFVPADVDKGRGLRALAADIGQGASIALAVGDSDEDIPLFVLAEHAAAPRNGSARALAAADSVGPPGARGLLGAVVALIGHQPGGCPRCRPPAPGSSDRTLLLHSLAALDGGRRAKLRALGLVGAQLARPGSGRRPPPRWGARDGE